MLVLRSSQKTSKGVKTGTGYMIETYNDDVLGVVSRFTMYNEKTAEIYSLKIYKRVPSKIMGLFA